MTIKKMGSQTLKVKPHFSNTGGARTPAASGGIASAAPA